MLVAGVDAERYLVSRTVYRITGFSVERAAELRSGERIRDLK